jgi:hypothetical protein
MTPLKGLATAGSGLEGKVEPLPLDVAGRVAVWLKALYWSLGRCAEPMDFDGSSVTARETLEVGFGLARDGSEQTSDVRHRTRRSWVDGTRIGD